MRFISFLFAILLLLSITSCGKRALAGDARLLLVLTADQFPFEYLVRFRPLFRGGLKRLVENGAVFSNAHFLHSDTATCPGHASLITGVHPARSGIVMNSWFDTDKLQTVYCVADSRHGRSPRNMLVSALPDWVDEASWRNKVFSVAGKDRAAIMLGGKSADAAYWYDDENGEITSSSYYQFSAPNWVKEFNRKQRWRRFFGSVWTPSEFVPENIEEYGIVDLYRDPFAKRFPHGFGGASLTPESHFFSSLYASPFLDEYINEFAIELIQNENLGKNSRYDYLAISYSALDTVGHGFGPNSLEVLDTLLRLDHQLGRLFEFLDTFLGRERYLVAFSSDHGVQPLPEYRVSENREAHRQSSTDVACIQKAGKTLGEEFGISQLFLGGLYLNHSALQRKNLDIDTVNKKVREEIERCRMIERLWTRAELLQGDSVEEIQQRFQRSFHPKRSGDFLVQLRENHLHSLREGTGHGSPYAYDTHVPIIFLSHTIDAQTRENPVSPIDIAPTLARLFGVDFPTNLDGNDLTALLSNNSRGTISSNFSTR